MKANHFKETGHIVNAVPNHDYWARYHTYVNSTNELLAVMRPGARSGAEPIKRCIDPNMTHALHAAGLGRYHWGRTHAALQAHLRAGGWTPKHRVVRDLRVVASYTDPDGVFHTHTFVWL